MATNYDGNSVAVQAPDSAPEPEKPPKVSLPADGDALNASSVAQAFKDLADHIHYALRPRAKQNDWGKRIQRWLTSAGHARFVLDHHGFPSGQIIQFDAAWPRDGFSSTYTFNSLDPVSGLTPRDQVHALMPDWHLYAYGAGGDGAATFGMYDAAGASFSWLGLIAGSTAGDRTIMSRGAPCNFSTQNHITAECTAFAPAGTVAAHTMWFGIGKRLTAAPTANIQEFAGFFGNPAGGNWSAFTMTGGVASLVTDTGIAMNATPRRLRVEWAGSNVADDSTSACRFYVDGVLKATKTTNLPVGKQADVICAAENVGGGAGGTFFAFGPVRFRANQFGGSVDF